MNASEQDVVIFTGSGCTGAVNKLIHALKFTLPVVSRLNSTLYSLLKLLHKIPTFFIISFYCDNFADN